MVVQEIHHLLVLLKDKMGAMDKHKVDMVVPVAVVVLVVLVLMQLIQSPEQEVMEYLLL